MSLGAIFLLIALPPASAVAQGTGTRFVNPAGLVKPTGYTHLVIAPDGRTVYIAGQVAFDSLASPWRGQFHRPGGTGVPKPGAGAASVGGSLADLVKTTTFVTDIKHLAALREVRGRYLAKTRPPANTLVAVSSLARPELLVEIEGVAILGSIVRH